MSILRRKQRGPVRYKPWEEAPDPRIFGRSYRGPSPAKIGLVLVILLAIASYLAFTKQIPFTSPGYELHATFQNATTLKPKSPVRIAGVNVGEVTNVSSHGNMAEVTFSIDNEGLPIHKDATVTIRPRLFLEGNFFLDLRPGSPNAPDLSSGGDIPVSQTATAVQLDQILTSLQKGNRTDLKQALAGYGGALTHKPTPAEDKTQSPSVHGLTAGQALNQTFKYGGKAGRTSSIVNEALLGEKPHDLSNLIRGQRNVFRELASDQGALRGFITNFNTTAGALASESNNLSATIRELAPTLEQAQPTLRHVDQSLPPFRSLAIQLEPGIRQLPETVRTGTPWLDPGEAAPEEERARKRRPLPGPGGSRVGADDRRGARPLPPDGPAQQVHLAQPDPRGQHRASGLRTGLSTSPPGSPTTASSSTPRSSSPVRASSSTATAPSSASRPAVVPP